MNCYRQTGDPLFSFLWGFGATPIEKADTKDKPEVIPSPTVIHGINGRIIPEQWYDEGEERDEAMQQPPPEAVDLFGEAGLQVYRFRTTWKHEYEEQEYNHLVSVP